MKFVKKLLALVLVLSMLLVFSSDIKAYSIEPAEYTDVNNEAIKSTLEVLSAYGIISGYPDGSFRPDKYVTRAEMAKICIMLMNYGDLTEGMTSVFQDMKGHWAERYADVLVDAGIVRGYEDKTYRPDEIISVKETAAVVLRLLGYKDLKEYNNLDYCHTKAQELKLYKDAYFPTEDMTRGNLVLIIRNMLNANPVYVNGEKIYNDKKNETYFSKLGTMERVEITKDYMLKHLDTDLMDYFSNYADVYYDNYGKIVLVNNLLYTPVRGYVDKMVSTNSISLVQDNGETKVYNIENAKTYFNLNKEDIHITKYYKSTLTLLLDRQNKPVVALCEKSTSNRVVQQNQTYDAGDKTFLGKQLPLDSQGNVDFSRIKVFGVEQSLFNIKENDVVYFYDSNETNSRSLFLKFEVYRNNVSGTITKAYDKSFVIDKEQYFLSPIYAKAQEISVNDQIIAFLDKDNKIVKLDIEKYGKEPDTYGIVHTVKNNISSTPTVGFLSQNGRFMECSLNDNSGLVNKSLVDNTLVYSTNVKAGDVIKYDLDQSNNIQIGKIQDTIYIRSNYDANRKILTNGRYSVNAYTTVVDYTGGTMKIARFNSLKDYVEGRACVDESGIVKFIVLNKNEVIEKEPEEVEAPPVDTTIGNLETKYTGTRIDIVKSVAVDSANNSSTVTFITDGKTFKVNSSIDIANTKYRNKVLSVEIVDDVVTGITAYEPEISLSKVTNIYQGQIQIDNVTYIEYENNSKVYQCVKDDAGNVTKFVEVDIKTVEIGDKIDFYNTNNNYSGAMNLMVIYK